MHGLRDVVCRVGVWLVRGIISMGMEKMAKSYLGSPKTSPVVESTQFVCKL